jgi:hypothetical protein
MLQTLPASCNHSFQSRHSALQFLLNFQCVSVISTTCAASLGSYIVPSKLYNCPPEDGFAQFHARKGIPHSGERQRRPTCTHVPHKHEASHDTNVLLERQNSRIQGVDLRLVVACNLQTPHKCGFSHLTWEAAITQALICGRPLTLGRGDGK